MIEIVSDFLVRTRIFITLHSFKYDEIDARELELDYDKRLEPIADLSKYNQLIKEVTEDMDQYDLKSKKDTGICC